MYERESDDAGDKAYDDGGDKAYDGDKAYVDGVIKAYGGGGRAAAADSLLSRLDMAPVLSPELNNMKTQDCI